MKLNDRNYFLYKIDTTNIASFFNALYSLKLDNFVYLI